MSLKELKPLLKWVQNTCALNGLTKGQPAFRLELTEKDIVIDGVSSGAESAKKEQDAQRLVKVCNHLITNPGDVKIPAGALKKPLASEKEVRTYFKVGAGFYDDVVRAQVDEDDLKVAETFLLPK
jgi:hypothetical protein